MKPAQKLGILAALALLVTGAVLLKDRNRPPPVAPAPPVSGLPKLLDLGADKCIPCKQMAPILAELRKDYADRFVTEFVDVWKHPDAGKQYGIKLIPTQIFFDADGKELFRHEGFYGREDILNKWKELGVNVANGKES